MSEIQKSLFDYSSLTPEVAREAMASAERVKLMMRRTASDIVEIGRELTETKAKLGHGNFLPWIEAEFGMSEASAKRFMAVADRFGKSLNLSDFKPSVLYLLASAPEPVVEAVKAKAEAGEKIDVKSVKAEIEKAKAEAAAAKAEAEADRRRATQAYLNLLSEKDRLAEELKTRPVVEKTVEKVVEKTVTVIPDGYSDEKAALEALKKKKDQAQREVSETYERKQRIQAELIELEERRRKYSDSEKEAKQHEAVLQELSRVLVHTKPDFDLFEEAPVPQMRNRWLDCATSLRIFADDIERWLDRDDARVIDIRQIEGAA